MRHSRADSDESMLDLGCLSDGPDRRALCAASRVMDIRMYDLMYVAKGLGSRLVKEARCIVHARTSCYTYSKDKSHLDET